MRRTVVHERMEEASRYRKAEAQEERERKKKDKQDAKYFRKHRGDGGRDWSID